MVNKLSRSAARQERRSAKTRQRNDQPIIDQVMEMGRVKPRINKAPAKPMTDAQNAYDAAMRSSQIIFGVGPAGTGKTWFAARRAAEALDAKVIDKIIVTRPAVEAGESLGFLPGELDEKYEPYFRPVRDALEEYFGRSHLDYMIKAGIIEARPLALLRGSTLKNCWVIADEMQNATVSQFKMFLSRIGENAKFIVNGDPNQTDLPSGSGLNDAVGRLERVGGVSVVRFTHEDIVRSGLCQAVVAAYEKPVRSFGEGLPQFLVA